MNSKFFLIVLLAGLLGFTIVPMSLLAAPYTPLVGIPGIDNPALKFGDYINALYALSISLGALLAVIKIIIAGMKYMLSDIVTSKQDAIKDIQGAVLGLLVVISAVLILQVINPQLKEVNISLAPVTSAPATSAPVAPVGVAINGPGYKAEPYIKEQEMAFRQTCTGAGGSYDYKQGDAGASLMVCYEAVPPAIISQIATKYLPKDRNKMKEIYQKTIIPRQVPPASVEGKITKATEYENVSISTIHLATEHPKPPIWLDNRAQENMKEACRALIANMTDSNERSYTRYIGDDTYSACVTLTPY